ncbi:MAG TPA: tetratricopeptide repeat protein [Micropepsaceae bacterium]|nr:tetratricopeptide repeat protein [Micropepsaceae bacterium]
MTAAQLRDAMRLRRSGRLTEAARIYAEILDGNPHEFEALHALGIISYQSGQLEQAERLVSRAVESNPISPDARYNHACLLQKLNRLEEAIAVFDAALALKPGYVEALANRGSTLMTLKRHREALESFDSLVELVPNLAQAWNNRAAALRALDRLAEALSDYGKALALKPDYVEALKNRGTLLVVEGKLEEGLADFDAALRAAPGDKDALRQRADVLAALDRNAEAISSYDQFFAKDGANAEAWHSAAACLRKLNRREQALSYVDKALALIPRDSGMLTTRAHTLFELFRFEEAAMAYDTLATSKPAPWPKGYRALSHLHCCDWSSLEADRRIIAAAIADGEFVLDPMGHLFLCRSMTEHRDCARIWVREKCPAVSPPLSDGQPYCHDRIRLGYLSSDFREHATAFLMAGVFEHHDRNRFETIAISFGTNDHSASRGRLEAAFDRFIDAEGKSDAAIARMIREMEIDIAVDLKGYTSESRPGILAFKPAPVQVSYLGYPGTMAADYMDYLLADRVVIPPDEQTYYSEKLIYFPDCYQCNDDRRVIAPSAPERSQAGLPDRGFVFCCFNNNLKIQPETFDIWMRLLHQVEGSVLWLLQNNEAVVRNLRREAEARGVAAERLCFAPRVELGLHLARHRLADLFLDTLPCCAHTTASDALWAGLPVLTCLGATFAGRVAASLLKSVGLNEMIAASPAEYEALALKLVCEPDLLAAIRGKLAAGRERSALFDTARFTRELERAYLAIWRRNQFGEPPQSFALDDTADARP